MPFTYDKKNAQCMWCKRTQNPHPDYSHETIPSKIFISKKGRRIELCFSCYENESKAISKDIIFEEKLDKKFEILKVLNL